MQREVAGELEELFRACHEVGLTVHLDQHPDLVACVDVALHGPLSCLIAGALGGLGLTTGAEDLDRPFGVAPGFGERLPASQHSGAGAIAQRLDIACGDLRHLVSSSWSGVKTV